MNVNTMTFKRIEIDGILEQCKVATVSIMNGNLVGIKTKEMVRSIIIDVKELKYALKNMGKEWFGKGGGKKEVVLRDGIFWSIFLQYLFPIFLDIAKCYCAIMVCKGFLQDRKGGNGDGRSGMQSLVYYGKFFLIFSLVPFAVELIDQIGTKMSAELKAKPLIDGSDIGIKK